MDALFHFLIPLILSPLARIRFSHAIFLAALSLSLDADHFFGVTRATLHNVFVAILLPIVCFMLAMKIEKQGTTAKRLAIGSLFFFPAHIIFDMADLIMKWGVRLFYPISNKVYRISFEVPINTSGGQSPLISTLSVGISLCLLILFGCWILNKALKD